MIRAMLRRSLQELGERRFDVLVIGGGAAGAAAAREAALRGYDTALIERDDFGGGASAHCFKVVHGGIRYLQHADIGRLRASCWERAILLRIAPHLVAPLPFAIPTFGHGKASKWFLGAGMYVYDALTRDCNAHIADPARRVRGTRFLSRAETLQIFPQIEAQGLTGAAIFEDGQMYNPPRLVLAFAAAAQKLGATVANYVGAEKLLIDGTRVTGVLARDRLGGDTFEIRARLVLNAAGPWAEGLLQISAQTPVPSGTYSRDACFLIARAPPAEMALALQGRTRDADALLARNARHLFLVPWRDRTLVGVWHAVVPREPDRVGLPREELRSFIAEINASYPTLRLEESEVRIAGFGLVPFGEASKQGSGTLSFGKQSRLIDHRRANGLEGLISSISVRYTVARMDAVAAIDLAGEQLAPRQSSGDSKTRPLPGGDVENFSAFASSLEKKCPSWLPRESCAALARNYGTYASEIFALGEREPALQRCLPGTAVSHAEVIYTVRQEMAQSLTDVLFRRTDLATAGHPGASAVQELQALLQKELSWSPARLLEEQAGLAAHLQRYLISDDNS